MMQSLPNIQRLIDQNNTEEAIKLLDLYLANSPRDDEAYFMRGRAYWKLQNYGAAITDYEHALEINPDSQAAAALELALDVLNFYNPDMLNP